MSRLDLGKMGRHIAEARKAKKYTQKQLGEIIDIDNKTISKWERGNIAPDITILKSLAEALDMELDELLSGEYIQKNEKDKRNEITLKAIDYYSQVAKKKITKIFIVVIAAILFVIGTIYTIDRYYRWDVKVIDAGEEFHVRGYIISNRKTTRYIFDEIDHMNNSTGTNVDILIKDIVVIIQVGNQQIEILKRKFKNEQYLLDIIPSLTATYIVNQKINNNDDNKLIIKYTDSKSENKIISVDF